ncbi:aspartate/glutamate racemase family protein [Pararhodobacter zhoushanensis]|uniref:aspartate/glutamate racemase family protein n=1 Tax=Pararhodobacter zhoushanensis TaxID=2479545 RepID=UPI000F8F6554|nr:aspartate/glutamate racemase family protein [Pararhodobacter zhoushanensis]
MHIGLIGGIGPAATVVYYERLVAAFRARGRVLELTIAQADVQVLARNAEVDDRAAQAAVYARHLAQLKGAGADFGTITSIGGHFCYAETEAISPLPLVSAIAPVDAGLAARGLRCVGVLGTRQVTGSLLYGQLVQTQALAPAEIEAVHSAYVGMATSGACTPDARALLFDEGARMIEQGAEAVLLAGTDLGLAFDGYDPGYPVIDALDLHVAHLVALAMG